MEMKFTLMLLVSDLTCMDSMNLLVCYKKHTATNGLKLSVVYFAVFEIVPETFIHNKCATMLSNWTGVYLSFYLPDMKKKKTNSLSKDVITK